MSRLREYEDVGKDALLWFVGSRHSVEDSKYGSIRVVFDLVTRRAIHGDLDYL